MSDQDPTKGSDQWATWRERVDLDEYEQRWKKLAESGQNPHGEADFVCRFAPASVLDAGCGMGLEATLYLTERGVRVTGTDGWSWDAPFSYTAKRYAQTKDSTIIWEGHKAGRIIGYCHMEKLSNLESLPSTGFDIVCFPVKIKAASAGWTRAVAIIND